MSSEQKELSLAKRAMLLRKQWTEMNAPLLVINLSVANGLLVMATQFLAPPKDVEFPNEPLRQCHFPLATEMIVCGMSAITVFLWQTMGRFLVDVMVSDRFVISKNMITFCKLWTVITVMLAGFEVVNIGRTTILVLVNFNTWQGKDPLEDDYCEPSMMIFASILFPVISVMAIVGLVAMVAITVLSDKGDRFDFWFPFYEEQPRDEIDD